ncbi:peptidase S51, partial [Lawsonibacter sp. DFI.6.74]|nr:peptidase S51 [Lawsonibacter sp. DFI.6.74]MCG4774332.1 peptidase S51 [Lawsonibacter sp. DFI.5.51]
AVFQKNSRTLLRGTICDDLCPINNRQGIVIDGEDSKVICKD